VVVVTGGLVVGGLVGVGDAALGAEAGGAVVVVGGAVVGGTAVVGGGMVEEGVVPPGVGAAFAPADEPGCSRATVTPMIVASSPAAATDARVTRRMRSSAAARA
jgi:hypothetical protein